MKNKKLKIDINFIIKIILCVMLFALCYFVPYTHDDWAWGSSIGIERFSNHFLNYNGRYFSNCLAILLTRNRLLRSITCFITLILLIKVITKLIGSKKDINAFLLVALCILMPYRIIAQSFAWTSGFVNYVFPILFVLAYIYLNKNMFESKKIELSDRWIIPLLLFGFISCLMVENMTIYIVLLSLFINLYQIVKHKKISLPNVAFLIGSIAGTILMFSNGAYANIFNSADTYRSIEQGNIIIRAIKTYIDSVCGYLIQGNIILNFILSGIFIKIIYDFYKNNSSKTKKVINYILGLCVIIIIGYVAYNLFVHIAGNRLLQKNGLKLPFEGLINMAFLLSIFVSIIICVKDSKRKFRLLFELFSIAIMTAPLLVVTPIGPRNFFATYVLFAMFAVDAFDYSVNEFKIKIDHFIGIIAIMLMLFYGIIYGSIFRIEKKRDKAINNFESGEVLYLPLLPFAEYMQNGNPVNEIFLERFKLFYNIDKNQKVKFVKYKTYHEKYEK